MTKPTSRRATAKSENRQVLLRAALHVFAHTGYESSTVRDIVDESGLSRGTFYNYLGDKESALRAVAAHLIERIGEQVEQARSSASDRRTFIRDAFIAMIDVLAGDPTLLAFVSRNGESLRSIVGDLEPIGAITQALQRDLDLAVEQGFLPAHRTGWLASAMVGATIEVVTRMESSDDPQLAGRFLSSLFLHGTDGLATTPE